ncbi:MAG TPA: head GIN domain-containing protein [Chitinophagaceae bacterium]|nr:head GIN domain-containing protein [Chitinophagaceae bacterium]
MQKFILSVALLLMLAGTRAVAQNVVYDANAQVRKVEHFTKIHVSSAISLYLSQGREEAVAVSAGDEKYTARIRTEVRDGVLKIYVENGAWNNWNWGNRSLKAYVTIVNLDGIEADGASSVKVSDPLHATGNFDLEISGASTVKFDGGVTANSMNIQVDGASNFRSALNAADVKFNLSGASQAEISGKSGGLTIEATGASEFKGFAFESENCKAEASGASTVSITVSKKLDAQASGASSIGYKGEAVITNLDVSGASNVKKRS